MYPFGFFQFEMHGGIFQPARSAGERAEDRGEGREGVGGGTTEEPKNG
jgi:hypothetical protein